ncbi:hypothetical protein GCM10027059_26320 [Myceligenerans halotolerans]
MSSTAASPHRLAMPRRSCLDETGQPGPGGSWYVPRDKENNGSLWWKLDYAGTLNRFPRTTRALLSSQIKRKLQRAMQGSLTYGHGREYDVEKMNKTDYVLEIRFDRQWGDNPQEQLRVRIYFNEPAPRQQVLKLLKMAAKHDYPLGKQEQDSHALDAQGRLDSCTFERLAA